LPKAHQASTPSGKHAATVTSIREFKADTTNASPELTEITLEISESLSTDYRSHGLEPLGKDHILRLTAAEGAKTITLKVARERQRHHQIIREEGNRTKEAMPLAPYLLRFTTR
jgi:hypothetical protein